MWSEGSSLVAKEGGAGGFKECWSNITADPSQSGYSGSSHPPSAQISTLKTLLIIDAVMHLPPCVQVRIPTGLDLLLPA